MALLARLFRLRTFGSMHSSNGDGHDTRWERHNVERQNRILAAAVELLEVGPAGAEIPGQYIAGEVGLAKSALRRE
ncbi:hypothetical protein ACFXJ5_39110 [Streptomyces sp. NPDC059373]